ncbi:helix-turn-helix domain-containing protein [Paenibacillus sp. J2TS4]|uniref:helix-turn-helix domain-containing protein n=1 Tax=Paenibacillus sp. J2TS4 TaxID=2807194 RepID=UPI001B09001C|nr:helix-turn-helix domain-containing protein [Paenibacillus sp. J2TS4]GIP33331.1 hypothetical protein J2TS4_25410 [Paenibacillus sp. J2TS4]
MRRNTKPDSFNMALFWRFFASYFILILIPAIVACTFTYFFIVRLIEEDAGKLNNAIMRNFSDQTDATFSTLKTNMIHMLSSSSLISFLAVAGDSADNQQRNELVHHLMEQLNKIESGGIMYNAYLYFVHEDLVIDFQTHTSKDFYFQYYYPIEPAGKPPLFTHFSDKKMMVFTEPHTMNQKPLFSNEILTSYSHISALMSYPFNSHTPEVYLVVNINRDKLRERIGIQENWVTGTAIMNKSGQVISQTGEAELEAATWLDTIQSNAEGTLVVDDQGHALSFMKSNFNEDWYYVSLIDLQTLLQPARWIRKISIVFLGFVLVLGSLVSYYLSRRLYTPIWEIKTGLESHHKPHPPIHPRGNDFDVIKRFSQLLITENKELSQMVGGMFPIVKEHFIMKILLGEYRDSLSIEYYAKEIDFPYQAKATRTVLCIEIQYYSRGLEQLSETSKTFLMVELKEKIRKRMPVTVWLCQTKADRIVCVIHHDALMHCGPREAAQIIQTIIPQPYYKATIGIGKTVQSIEHLHASYEYALAMLRYKGLHSEVEICSEEHSEDNRPPWDGFLSVQEVNRIFNRFKSRDYAPLLQSVYDQLEAGIKKNATALQIKGFCSDVLNTWIRAVETERNDFSISFYSGLFDKLDRCVTWEEIRQFFQDIHTVLFRVEEPDARQGQFAEILEFIHTRYGEELSIDRFAERMGMSVGHFSRTFKEEVGEKYVEYIAKVRLAQAKRLLLETDLKIDEIAEQVGYWGRNSFIRIFRRYEGTTPAKYRTIHRK